MKKKFMISATVAFVSMSLMCSCGEDPAGGREAKGSIAPAVDVDAGFLDADVVSKASAELSAGDLTMTITSQSDGSVHYNDLVSAFDPKTEFPVGDYTVEVSYADPAAEGFDADDAYYDTQDIKVYEGQSTPVALNATRAHAVVSVEFTEAFSNYIKRAGVDVVSSSGKATTFVYSASKVEDRTANIVPGQTKVLVDLEKNNGTEAKALKVADFKAEARHHYHIKVDINSGGVGSAMLTVTFDQNPDDFQTLDIDLSDEMLNAPAPEIAIEGVENGGTIDLVETVYGGDPVVVSIIARGEVASVKLSTASTFFQDTYNWSSEVELVGLDNHDKYSSNGLDCKGLWGTTGKMAVIDFTKAIGLINYMDPDAVNNNISTFTITATDRNGKSAEQPVTFSVKVDKMNLALSNPGELKFFDTEIALDMVFNGGVEAARNVKFEYKNGRATWNALEVKSIEAASGENTYRVVLAGLPDDTDNVNIKASYPGISHINVALDEVARTGAVARANDNDVFATRAYVSISAVNVAEDAIDNPIFKVGETTITATPQGNNLYLLEGLAPGQATSVSVELAGGVVCVPAEFTTEAATQLPDANFDNWSAEKKGDLQYLWKVENSGAWSTVNALTTSQSGSGIGSAAITGGSSYKATSGTIPANGRSNQSTASGGLFGTSKHSDGHTVGNKDLHNDRAYNGSPNAALIRTVGWGSGNSAKSGTKENAGFATCQNQTPGQLYLGSYTNDGPQYGYTFASRPSEVRFYYHYDVVSSGNGDYGTAEVKVFDASGSVIASGKLDLAEQDSYKQVSIPLSYASGAKKASKISVVFVSSANEAALQKDTKFWRTPGGNNTSGGEYVGSELYIDDIELIY